MGRGKSSGKSRCRPVRYRWHRVLPIAIAVVLVLVPAGTASGQPRSLSATTILAATSTPHWWDGQASKTFATHCVTNQHGVLSSASVGWFGDLGSSPQVGRVYYVRVWWGTAMTPCFAGVYTHVEVGLPSHTRLAVSSSTPVRCWFRASATAGYGELADCPQRPSQGQRGDLAFDPPGGAWPSGTGTEFQIWIPLVTTQPLNGLVTEPCEACFRASLWFIDGLASPWALPRVGVPVVDTIGPRLSSPRVSPNRFEPIPRDGDRDVTVFALTTSERSRVFVRVYDRGTNRLRRVISTGLRAPGRQQLTWNGRTASGRQLRGRFAVQFLAFDEHGNSSRTPRYALRIL